MTEQMENEDNAGVRNEENIQETSEVVFTLDEPGLTFTHPTNTNGQRWENCDHITHNHVLYKPGQCVELLHPEGHYRKGDFLQICSISQNVVSGRVLLSGLRLRRNRFSDGMLTRRLNELHLRLQVSEDCPDDLHSIFNHALVEHDINRVVQIRQVLFTNKLAEIGSTRYGDDSFRDSSAIYSNSPAYRQKRKRVFCNGLLVCRWIFLTRHERIPERNTSAPKQFELRRLQESELKCSDMVQRFFHNVKSAPDIDLFRTWHGTNANLNNGHTFCDAFCGGGGASEAATTAGLDVKYAFDEDRRVLRTYQDNRHRSTEVFHSDVWNFFAIAESLAVDVLHLSPPCTYFSASHTISGRNDDKNSAALFSVHELIDKIKPRIVTLEQTASIISRHTQWFSALINQFTSLNFGVRWSSINFKDYGLAQSRSRLIILASCPGTSPPLFARPSHNHGRDSPQSRSISDVLQSIPQQLRPQHSMVRISNFSMPPYDGRTRLAACITRDGGNPRRNYHPSGLRPFSVRELAALQGFRHDFVLPKLLTLAKHIIGNAVPPSAFAPLLAEVKRYLEKQDSWIVRESERIITIE